MNKEKYEVDKRRTRGLGLLELQVISGNPTSRNQGNMHRDYLDVIPRGDDVAIITITLEFRRAKCLSSPD